MSVENKVSVIIVNWNGEKWLGPCIDSLQSQTYRDIEVIVVDNASTDKSVELIRIKYPLVKIIQSSENLGFAGGNNVGVKEADGEYIMLLNNDTCTEKDCIEKLVRAFDMISGLTVAQPKILLMDDPETISYCGNYLTGSSFLYAYGYRKNRLDTRYNKPMPFFSVSGAAMMIKREVIDKIGLFDDLFWCYYEDVDFCHRVWLTGSECWYFPAAAVYHHEEGTAKRFEGSEMLYHTQKNRLSSILTNFESRTLAWILPMFIVTNIVLCITRLLEGDCNYPVALFKAIAFNIKNAKAIAMKRKQVRCFRRASDQQLFTRIKKTPGASYYYYWLTGKPEAYED